MRLTYYIENYFHWSFFGHDDVEFSLCAWIFNNWCIFFGAMNIWKSDNLKYIDLNICNIKEWKKGRTDKSKSYKYCPIWADNFSACFWCKEFCISFGLNNCSTDSKKCFGIVCESILNFFN
jgi:hypothetical protein